jgi:hypothetical protein
MEDETQQKLLTSYAMNTAVSRFRAKEIATNELESRTCQSLAKGCGKATGVGHEIFTIFINNNTGLDTLGGFGDVNGFAQIESSLKTNYFSSYSSGTQNIYGVISTAILLGGYASNLPVSELETFFSGAFNVLSGYYAGPAGPYFTQAQLSSFQSTYNLSGTLEEIFNNSPKTFKTNKIYFQYYDLDASFAANPDLHKFKDSAIQHYSISGDLNYDGAYWDDTPDCNEIEVPVFGADDVETVSKYYYVGPESFPCIDRHSETRPVTGVEFYRKFVDGPYSTGEWTQSIYDVEYLGREKTGIPLQTTQYESNRKIPTQYYGQYISSMIQDVQSVTVEAPYGEYFEPHLREKSDSPKDGQITWYHVGNATGARTGRVVSHYHRDPTNGQVMIENYKDNPGASTGIKFIPLKLKESEWSDELGGTFSNPLLASGRIYQMALNMHSGHSIDLHSNRLRRSSGIAGPPQRDDLSDFPYITLVEDFQSKTNDTYPSVMLGYGLSNSERYLNKAGWQHQIFMSSTTGSGAFPTKFQNKTFYDPDELVQPNVEFEYSITTLEGQLVRAHVLGFGNNIDGGKAEKTYEIKNGFYTHSGRLHSGVVGISDTGHKGSFSNLVLVSGYSGHPKYRTATGFGPVSGGGPSGYGSIYSDGCVIGSREYYDEFIIGWKHSDHGRVDVTRMYAYYTGTTGVEEYIYSGFDSGRTADDVTQFPHLDRAYLAENIIDITGAIGSGWRPIKKRQRRENFFPRYFRGPFATARKKFLYKHAQDAYTGSSEFGTIGANLTTVANRGDWDFYNSTGQVIPIQEYNSGGFIEKAGFPHFIVFDLEVKEYATKEFYEKTEWNAFGNPVAADYSIEGIDPALNNITWATKDTFSETDSVDRQFAGPSTVINYGGGYQDIFMGYTGVNPLIYNSPPNFVQGFVNDCVGWLSGSNNTVEAGGGQSWPDLLRPDSGAYIVRWKDTLNGSSVGDWKKKNPDGNYTLYRSHKRRLTGIYTPPGYRLSDNKFHKEFANRIWGTGIQLLGESPTYKYGYPGSDPLYYKRVSSITGVGDTQTTEIDHGGFHPNGLHGDSWMTFSPSGVIISGGEAYYAGGGRNNEYGYGHVFPSWGNNPLVRRPHLDYGIILLDMMSTGFGFHFRALDLYPNTGRQCLVDYQDETGFFKSGNYTGYGIGGALNIFDFPGRKYTFFGNMQTGELYSVPRHADGSPWPSWEGSGSGSNTIWPDVKEIQKDHTGEWRRWRSRSKIELQFTNVTFSGHGQLPYDEEHIYVPSGSCRIEGKMAYEHMGEAPVFSEGMYMEDTTKNDPIKTRGNYSNYLSDVLKEHSVSVSVPLNVAVQPAPSRQMTLANPNDDRIAYPADFTFLNTIEKDYNKYLVFAKSDYATLNAGVLPSYEGRPIADDQVYPRADMLFSANKGQQFPNNTENPYVIKQYTVTDQRQYYEGELTDAVFDPRFMTQSITQDIYEESNNGQFIPANVTLREGTKGLY